jgi:hypothetical protein
MHNVNHSPETAAASVSEQAARLASVPSLPDELRKRVTDELISALKAVARIEQLELDGIEPAPRAPVWR